MMKNNVLIRGQVNYGLMTVGLLSRPPEDIFITPHVQLYLMEIKFYCQREFSDNLESICGWKKFQFFATLENIWRSRVQAIKVPVM